MATTRKINILLDEELIRRARDADPAQAGRGDAEVIERAATRYVARKALDEMRADGTVSEEEAERAAVYEVRAVRQARRDAA
jgi:hypothetical protein